MLRSSWRRTGMRCPRRCTTSCSAATIGGSVCHDVIGYRIVSYIDVRHIVWQISYRMVDSIYHIVWYIVWWISYRMGDIISRGRYRIVWWVEYRMVGIISYERYHMVCDAVGYVMQHGMVWRSMNSCSVAARSACISRHYTIYTILLCKYRIYDRYHIGWQISHAMECCRLCDLTWYCRTQHDIRAHRQRQGRSVFIMWCDTI